MTYFGFLQLPILLKHFNDTAGGHTFPLAMGHEHGQLFRDEPLNFGILADRVIEQLEAAAAYVASDTRHSRLELGFPSG